CITHLREINFNPLQTTSVAMKITGLFVPLSIAALKPK
ncbi:MAG: hypothetical protein ACI9EA_002010, partial [Pseudomonadales bacterium]